MAWSTSSAGLLRGVLIVALLAVAQPAVAADGTPLRARVQLLQQDVAEARGLQFKSDVHVQVETPAQMRIHMEEEIAEHLDEETRLGLNLTWRALGLVEGNFDVGSAYAEILEDHVGGYFDLEEQRLVLIERRAGQGGASQDMVTAHELVHALQDQNFDLWKLTRRELDNDDVSAALQALVEGDASYAMLYHLPLPVDPDELAMDELLRMMGGAGGPSEEMGGALGRAPMALREPLIFPYTYGLAFAQQVKLSAPKWAALDAAFAQPPLSTEQILHPEKFVGDEPDWPTLLHGDAADILGPGWALANTDTFGELGMQVVLKHHLGQDAEQPGAGWDGDRLWLWHHAQGDQVAVLWVSTWDDRASARAFADDIQRVAHELQGASRWNARGDRGRGDGVQHWLTHDGLDVVVALGMPKDRKGPVRRFVRQLERREASSLADIAPEPTEDRQDHGG